MVEYSAVMLPVSMFSIQSSNWCEFVIPVGDVYATIGIMYTLRPSEQSIDKE